MGLSTAGAGRECNDTARALWFEAPGRCAVREEPLPPTQGHEARVKALFSGISRGTESTVFKGLVPDSERERMRGPHMGGEFPFPVKYGYALVGLVEEGPETLAGKTVFALYPHQDRLNIDAAMVTPLPPGLPAERAVLTANMETALNIVWDALIQPGDRVAVFGAGVVGTLTAYLSSRIAGTETLLIDRDPERAALASALGLDFAPGDGVAGEFDVLINASGAPAALAQAIALAGIEARIVEASWYGERRVTVPLGGAFHSRRLSIVSSQVGSVPPHRRARWTFKRRLEKAMDLLQDARLDALISGETAFDDLQAAYPRILDATDTLCHRVRYT
ncbi:NADPH:quinone reductase-like Zn-dependent oxidoreductase [Neorhizobium galegae]|uniref:zinc-dependent alcohol dehydrogenase n=1 Tax=Neorhizobium galegae TaxID=399 RepID=UPI001AE42D17|nr:zinc-binding alcohol dehydrogenase [Neorhizobium galegae]MBP2550635.1 NADPH:quinone reductase-like Zn-dependent oxidoreductase [Neorhizobium galegae]